MSAQHTPGPAAFTVAPDGFRCPPFGGWFYEVQAANGTIVAYLEDSGMAIRGRVAFDDAAPTAPEFLAAVPKPHYWPSMSAARAAISKATGEGA